MKSEAAAFKGDKMAKSGKARSQTVKNRKKDKIDFAQRFMWVLTVFFLALFPLLFDSTKYGKLTRAKFTYFAAAALICIIVLILYYISAVLVGAKKMPDMKKALARTSFAQKAMAAYLLIAVISAILPRLPEARTISIAATLGLSRRRRRSASPS